MGLLSKVQMTHFEDDQIPPQSTEENKDEDDKPE